MRDLLHPLRVLRELRTFPRVTITMTGDSTAHERYVLCSRPHPRYRVFPAKSLGAALLPVPDQFDAYLAGHERKDLRRGRRRALEAGYRFAAVPSAEHISDIAEINQSLPTRQGRPMDARYLDTAGIEEYCHRTPVIDAILDSSGRVRAYSSSIRCGEVVQTGELIGHGDHLRYGIMYLLVSEVVRVLVDRRQATGAPDWYMYDTYLGASPGLREFKRHLGFEPHIVTWRWRGAC